VHAKADSCIFCEISVQVGALWVFDFCKGFKGTKFNCFLLAVLVLKEYDLIVIGTGTGMELASAFVQENPKSKIAVIDKDEPGGICLTRGCIPSKLLLYPADIVRTIEKAEKFGIHVQIKKIDSSAVLERMRTNIKKDIDQIRNGLTQTPNIDFYQTTAEFVAPYTLKVGEETISSKMIFLSLGSRPFTPNIEGLAKIGYLTSDTILSVVKLPDSMGIIGGGYIAAEYGHFLSAMGCKVTIVGSSPRVIPEEEPEISALAKREMQKHMTVITGYQVQKVEKTLQGKKRIIAFDKETQKEVKVEVDEILVAVGRRANTDILHPENSGVKLDDKGFVVVNEYLETTQPNIWVVGDADGAFMFKHVANYEAQVVYDNAILKNKVKVDYSAVPHAVFTEPEIAGVGLKEVEAIAKYGKDNVVIGFAKFAETAKGEAMALEDEFVKVMVERGTLKILGAHIIGPQASVLIQEIVNLMYTSEHSAEPLLSAMHIHPALSEVVEKAFRSLMLPEQYHHVMHEHMHLEG
jgi:mycothione reductase